VGIPLATLKPVIGLTKLVQFKKTYQWIRLPKRELRFSDYDAVDKLGLSLASMKELNSYLTPIVNP